MVSSVKLTQFNLLPGRKLAGRYEVVGLLGIGWESEVYLVRELATGVERAAKVFFPERNPGNRVARRTAEKLHKLRGCQALIQYVTQEKIVFQKQNVTVLISEYVDGELLSDFIAKQPGQRLHRFEALHLLHALAVAVEPIHERREYHGDLHSGNVIVQRIGIGFDIRLIDIFHHAQRKTWSIQGDVVDLIRLFYDAIGGSRFYSREPKFVKEICGGLMHTLINSRFRNAGQLRRHLESFRWQ
jgi:tRNA A-37 threonylcarbamoyl transferase component Bud32